MWRRLSRYNPFSTTSSSNSNSIPSSTTRNMSTEGHMINTTPEEWREAIASLPPLSETGGRIPSIFLAHGQPMLITPASLLSGDRLKILGEVQGPNGALANFLRDFGPALVDKYSPRAIVVFSAHWETNGGSLVTDYQGENPLLYDYFGFHPTLYKEDMFHSRPDHALSERVVSLLKSANLPARLLGPTETRGEDGRGGRGTGLDHGVFVPFKLMFGDHCKIPIVQVSLNSSLDPTDEFALGAALEPLRSEGILIISGGLTIHTFQDFGAFALSTAKDVYKQFEKSIVDGVAIEDPEKRKLALFETVKHPGFRKAHPREEHYVPLFVAMGAADKQGGKATTVMGHHGCKTIVFGV